MTLDGYPVSPMITDGHHELYMQDAPDGLVWYVFIADTEIELGHTANAHHALSLWTYIEAQPAVVYA